MNKQDRRTLIYLVSEKPEKPDAEIARSCDCSIETVKKYRAIHGPRRPGPAKADPAAPVADRTPTHTLSFKMTDAPGYLSHFEITLDGDKLVIQSVKRSGYMQAEAELKSREFFDLVDRIRP